MENELNRSKNLKIGEELLSREFILHNQNGEAKFEHLHVDHIELPKKIIDEHDSKFVVLMIIRA